jgi:uncharacterized protein YbaP (TraB family)
MKTYFSLLWAALFAFISCSSHSTEDEVSINQEKDVIINNGNSLLWRIEGEGIQTSYMYGTMHMIDEEYYQFTDVMIEKINESDAIIMEVGGMPNPLETMELMSLDSGDIRDVFSQQEMKTVVEFFDQNLDTDPDTFFKIYGEMKPFFIMQAISQGYFSKNTKSYDLDIMGLAGQNETPLIGLETLEQQLGFFDAIPQEKMNEMVIQSIEDFEKEKKNTAKMMKIYSQQKVDKLIPMMQKQSPEFMEYSDIFLYDRNKAWIPRIKTELKSKKCFIAVGAAHLFGENGLIDLLQKEGFTLTAISTEA